MLTKDSLYAIVLANGRAIVTPGSLSHADIKLFFHILYSHQKFTKDGLYHEYIQCHRVNFRTHC